MSNDELIEFVRRLYIKYNIRIEELKIEFDDDSYLNIALDFSGVKYRRTFCAQEVVNSILMVMGDNSRLSPLEEKISSDVSLIRQEKLKLIGI